MSSKGRTQAAKVGQSTTNLITLNTGDPQGCVLSPPLYSHYTHNCVLTHLHSEKLAEDK